MREEIKKKLTEKIGRLKKKPVLVIVQAGNREDSNVYIRNKIKFGGEIGAEVVLKKYDKDIREEELIGEIEKLNNDLNVDGIIVQLPLPDSLNSEKILEFIGKNKDADGLKGIEGGGIVVTPATARAVIALLDFYKVEIKSKKATVIGRSKLAGGPIAESLKKRGAVVEVCHRGTQNTAEICREADILVSAAGQAGLVDKNFVNSLQVVVDVGINRIARFPTVSKMEGGKEINQDSLQSKLVGDVDFEEVEPIVKAVSPVPGGVGPVTVACLFENLLDLLDSC